MGENLVKVVALASAAGAPLLILVLCRRYSILQRVYHAIVKVGKRLAHSSSERGLTCAKSIMVISLMLAVIMIPRVEMLIAQGGIQEMGESQLKSSYGAFYELIVEKRREFDSGILTFKAPMGLPYYLPEVNVIDLKYPANLATLKDCLLLDSTYETVAELMQRGINYLLVNPSFTRELDASLDFTISKIIRNPELAILSQSLDSWRLYTLGSFTVEKAFINLVDWTMDSRYTNASYELSSTEPSLTLELQAVDIDSRVTIRNLAVPQLNLTNYDYLSVRVEDPDNARILLRFFLDDGSSFDVAYWKDPYTLVTTPFDLSPYAGRTLRGDAYLGLKSTDGTTSSIEVTEIAFANVKS